jgi:hypothetical protein
MVYWLWERSTGFHEPVSFSTMYTFYILYYSVQCSFPICPPSLPFSFHKTKFKPGMVTSPQTIPHDSTNIPPLACHALTMLPSRKTCVVVRWRCAWEWKAGMVKVWVTYRAVGRADCVFLGFQYGARAEAGVRFSLLGPKILSPVL